MSVSILEEKITPDLKWGKIEDIPNFPLSSFADIKQQVGANKFSIGIDFTTSNQLAEWLYGKGHCIFFLILASAPTIVAIASIVLAFVLGNYWILLGIILGFIGQFLSNPYNPLKSFLKPIIGILFLIFLYGLWQGKETIAYLTAFFVLPFFINSYLYEMNQNRLKAVAIQSEKVFIYLYQTGKLGLKDNSSEQCYWHFDGAECPK